MMVIGTAGSLGPCSDCLACVQGKSKEQHMSSDANTRSEIASQIFELSTLLASCSSVLA